MLFLDTDTFFMPLFLTLHVLLRKPISGALF